MNSKNRFAALAFIVSLMLLIGVFGRPWEAKAVTAATPISIGTSTPVVVVPQGNKQMLTLCNTGTTNAAYCLQTATGTGTVSSTNWNILVPAAATTAGATLANCWQAPMLQKPTQLGQSAVSSDPISCVGVGATTLQYFYR